MAETLDQLWRRYAQDPEAFAREQTAPLLLFETPDTEPLRTLSTHQLHTISKSGYQHPFLGPGAVALPLAARAGPSGEARIRLGRTAENDLVIDHPSISRHHAWFELHPRKAIWQVADAGSRNGTVVNSRRLSARVFQLLGDEAVVGFGDVNAQFLNGKALVRFLATRKS